jgi:hypothetical protein
MIISNMTANVSKLHLGIVLLLPHPTSYKDELLYYGRGTRCPPKLLGMSTPINIEW